MLRWGVTIAETASPRTEIPPEVIDRGIHYLQAARPQLSLTPRTLRVMNGASKPSKYGCHGARMTWVQATPRG